ncbi:MAG: LamG domain-containing protein, partial [Armatimonadetes bacterium]|nr:LamG domain-containing protein [Armatimonadota bacterium]
MDLRRLIPCLLCAAAALAQPEAGLVGAWSFDEGQGTVARDGSGQGNDGRLHGCSWVKRGSGWALSFNGLTDQVDCGDAPGLDLTGAVTLEAWIRPTGSPSAEPLIFGKYYDSYGVTMYGANGCWFYISGGGNNVNSTLKLNDWNHVAATFDGTTMTLYINRVKVGSKTSKAPRINHGGRFRMGVLLADAQATDPGYSGTAHWRGVLDDVRVYNRALSEAGILGHYKQSARGFGVDTSWFDRLRVVVYPHRAEHRLAVLLDSAGLFPRPADCVLTATLARDGAEQPVRTQEVKPVPDRQTVFFDLAGLPAGRYRIDARLVGGALDTRASQLVALPLAEPGLPDPAKARAAPLPPAPAPPKFALEVAPGGGFTLSVKGHRLPLASSFSFPNAGDNHLLAGAPDTRGEAGWKVTTRKVSGDRWEVTAAGRHYRVARTIRLQPQRVCVADSITNLTGDNLGVIVDNHLDAAAAPFTNWFVAGYPGADRRKGAESPTVFAAWPDRGVGLVPLDDVYIAQSTCYAEKTRTGALTDTFGLGPRASYTLEWAVYPVGGPDYYEFINRVRHDEVRPATVPGGFAFVPQTPALAPAEAALRNLAFASFGCLCNVADDPQIEIEGIDFLWLPQERARLKERLAAIREANPQLKLMFHIAHTLVSTSKPAELYPDSRVLSPDGSQVVYPYDYTSTAYFTKERLDQGYRWYCYYPAPGNSFHDALMRSVDVLVDDIGATGAFMDGFMYGYGSRVTYDRWDGHSFDIDPQTKTVKRPIGNVLILSQASMAEFARRMHARGATVIANGCVNTRTIRQLPILTDQECNSGPQTHLGQTPCALGNAPVLRGETDVYRDILDKLSWGLLYFYYGEGTLTHPSLPQRQFPITVSEIHSGTVIGRERIVTMRSGAYGWRGDRSLVLGYRYNPLGAAVDADFVTTVDAAGART